MPTITITGDTTQKALEQVLYRGIGLYGKDFNVVISENLRFENQNEEIKDYKQKVRDTINKLSENNIVKKKVGFHYEIHLPSLQLNLKKKLGL